MIVYNLLYNYANYMLIIYYILYANYMLIIYYNILYANYIIYYIIMLIFTQGLVLENG